jgi:hypothetical protein
MEEEINSTEKNKCHGEEGRKAEEKNKCHGEEGRKGGTRKPKS